MRRCGLGVAAQTSRKAGDSLGVRKRARGQNDAGFREGLVWQEEGAAGTITPPPRTISTISTTIIIIIIIGGGAAPTSGQGFNSP